MSGYPYTPYQGYPAVPASFNYPATQPSFSQVVPPQPQPPHYPQPAGLQQQYAPVQAPGVPVLQSTKPQYTCSPVSQYPSSPGPQYTPPPGTLYTPPPPPGAQYTPPPGTQYTPPPGQQFLPPQQPTLFVPSSVSHVPRQVPATMYTPMPTTPPQSTLRSSHSGGYSIVPGKMVSSPPVRVAHSAHNASCMSVPLLPNLQGVTKGDQLCMSDSINFAVSSVSVTGTAVMSTPSYGLAGSKSPTSAYHQQVTMHIGQQTFNDLQTKPANSQCTKTMTTAPTATVHTGTSVKSSQSCSNVQQSSIIPRPAGGTRPGQSSIMKLGSNYSNDEQMDLQELTEALYRTFAGLLQEHGPMESTHEKVLGEFIRLTTLERKLIMAQGSIKNFLATSECFNVEGSLLSLSGIPFSSRAPSCSYPQMALSSAEGLDIESLDGTSQDTGIVSQVDDGIWNGEDKKIFEQVAYSHGIVVSNPCTVAHTPTDSSYEFSTMFKEDSNAEFAAKLLSSTNIIEGGMYGGQWASGDSEEVLHHSKFLSNMGNKDNCVDVNPSSPSTTFEPQKDSISKAGGDHNQNGVLVDEAAGLSTSKATSPFQSIISTVIGSESHLPDVMPCVDSAKNKLTRFVAKEGGTLVNTLELVMDGEESGWAKGFLRSDSNSDKSSSPTLDKKVDKTETIQQFDNLDKAIDKYVQSWTEDACPVVKTARDVVLTALLGAKEEALNLSFSSLNPSIAEFKPKLFQMPSQIVKGLQTVLDVNCAEFHPSTPHIETKTSVMNAAAVEFKPSSSAQNEQIYNTGISNIPNPIEISLQITGNRSIEKCKMNASASVFTPKLTHVTVAGPGVNGKTSQNGLFTASKMGLPLVYASPSLQGSDFKPGATNLTGLTSACTSTADVASTSDMPSTSVSAGLLLDKSALMSTLSRTVKGHSDFHPRIIPNVSDFRPRGVASIPNLRFLTPKVSAPPKFSTGVQTDLTASCDVSTNTRRRRTVDFTAQTYVYNMGDVGVNTVETLFSKESDFFDKSLEYVTRETMTELPLRNNKKVQVGLPFLFHKPVRHRATMTEPTGVNDVVDTIDSLMYDEAVSRAVQAEEKVLKLEAHICLAELMRMLSDMDSKYQYHLSEKERSVVEADYCRSAELIKEEMNRLEVMFQSNLSALRDGLRLSQLPPIRVSYPQQPCQVQLQPSKLWQQPRTVHMPSATVSGPLPAPASLSNLAATSCKISANTEPVTLSNRHSPVPSDYASVTSEPAEFLGFSEYSQLGANPLADWQASVTPTLSVNSEILEDLPTPGMINSVSSRDQLSGASIPSSPLPDPPTLIDNICTDQDIMTPVPELQSLTDMQEQSTIETDNSLHRVISTVDDQKKPSGIENVPASNQQGEMSQNFDQIENSAQDDGTRSKLEPSEIPSNRNQLADGKTDLQEPVVISTTTVALPQQVSGGNTMENQSQPSGAGSNQSLVPVTSMDPLMSGQIEVPDLSALPSNLVLQAQVNPLLPQIMMALGQMSPALAMNPQLLSVVAVNHLVSMQMAQSTEQNLPVAPATGDVNRPSPALPPEAAIQGVSSVIGSGLTIEDELKAQKVLKALYSQQSGKRLQTEDSSDREKGGNAPKAKKRIGVNDNASNSCRITQEKSSVRQKYGPVKSKRKSSKRSPTSVSRNMDTDSCSVSPSSELDSLGSRETNSNSNYPYSSRGSRKSSLSSDISSFSGSQDSNVKRNELEDDKRQEKVLDDSKSVENEVAESKHITSESGGIMSTSKKATHDESAGSSKEIIESQEAPPHKSQQKSSKVLKSWDVFSKTSQPKSPRPMCSTKSQPSRTKKRVTKVDKDSDVTLNYGNSVPTSMRSVTPESWEDDAEPFPSAWKVGTEFAHKEIKLPENHSNIKSPEANSSKGKFSSPEGIDEGFTFSMRCKGNPFGETDDCKTSSREGSMEKDIGWDIGKTLHKPGDKFENLWKTNNVHVSNDDKVLERTRAPQYGSMLSSSGFKAPGPISSHQSPIPGSFQVLSSASISQTHSATVQSAAIDPQDWPSLGSGTASGARVKTGVWGSAGTALGKPLSKVTSCQSSKTSATRTSTSMTGSVPTVLGKVSSISGKKLVDSTNPMLRGDMLDPKKAQALVKRSSGFSIQDTSEASALSEIKVYDDIPGKDVEDKTDEWKQVSGKKKKGKGDMPLPHGTTTSGRNNNFEKLVTKLQDTFHYLSRDEILELIHEIRLNRGGLKGLSLIQIMADAQTVVKDWKLSHKVQLLSSAGLNPEQMNNILYKTAICSFWQQGSCPNGSKCSYAHGKQELRHSPKYILCHNWKKGSCTYGPKCVFAHGEQELVPPPKDFIRTKQMPLGSTMSPAKKDMLLSSQTQSGRPTWAFVSASDTRERAPVPGTIYQQVVLTDDEDGDLDTCIICYDPIKEHEGRKLECGHEFHERCIMRWIMGEERTCPTCRRHALTKEDFPALGK